MLESYTYKLVAWRHRLHARLCEDKTSASKVLTCVISIATIAHGKGKAVATTVDVPAPYLNPCMPDDTRVRMRMRWKL